MVPKPGCWRAVMALSMGLLAPATVLAGPYLGDWSWCWHPARDCPRGDYCPLHYWTPGLYKIRMYVHPSNLDQYPPGPYPPVSPSFETTKYPCRAVAPFPSAPYADPAGYFRRQLVPADEQAKEK
jgi:hypothetical protein